MARMGILTVIESVSRAEDVVRGWERWWTKDCRMSFMIWIMWYMIKLTTGAVGRALICFFRCLEI